MKSLLFVSDGKSDAGIFLEVVSLSAEAMTEAFEDEDMIEELYLRKESNEKKLSFSNMQNTICKDSGC
jgi:hypothetical protein